MQQVFPDYYKQFRCINKACLHNCCIGWEIDIDDKTASFYRNVGGELGKRLKNNISYEGVPHFILGKNERCPFLNENNLCNIITVLGEEHLCDICAEHPRFHNELPYRVETGLGLSCEAAARLILGKKEPVRLLISGESDFNDEIIILRDSVITALQNRKRSIAERIENMLFLCNTSKSNKSIVDGRIFYSVWNGLTVSGQKF